LPMRTPSLILQKLDADRVRHFAADGARWIP
jgi:hypothetical protein